MSVDCSDLFDGLRSYHIRHSRGDSSEALVGHPVHVIFYRARDVGAMDRPRAARADAAEPACRGQSLTTSRAVVVNGPAWKALIAAEFGNGIMRKTISTW